MGGAFVTRRFLSNPYATVKFNNFETLSIGEIMKHTGTVTPLLVIMILSVTVLPFWLTFQFLPPYGIILRFEGDKLVVNGEEVCKDIVGGVIVKFGSEFQSIDICDLIEKKVIHVFFSEGVRDWVKRLEELGVKAGMRGEYILETLESRGYSSVVMPTVSVTFWLIGEDVHYVANGMYTSLDYLVSIGYDYHTAFLKMFEDPLAIVREHGTILIRSEDLVKSLAPINMTRALEEIRKELGLKETTSSSAVSSPSAWRGCPPGTKTVSTGVCEWENYWELSETPPDWFYSRTIVESSDKNYVVGKLWQGFKKYFGTAYLFHKDVYRTKEEAIDTFWFVWSNPCFHSWSDFGKPVNMSTALKNCINSGFSYQVSWNHTRTLGSEFTMYEPLVVRVESSIGEMPPLEILLEYGSFKFGFKKTGFSIMGVLIHGNQEYSVSADFGAIAFNPWQWSNRARSAALIIPTYMKYLYDALILTWNIRSYYYDFYYGSFWLFEPVPVITPYYEEKGRALSDYWGHTYYDEHGNCIYGCRSYPQNVYDLIEEVTGTLDRVYYVINSTRFNDIPNEYVIVDKSNITSIGYSDSLGSIIFGVAKSIVVDLFLGRIPRPFGELLGFLDYTDTTFSGSVVIQRLWWGRTNQTQNNVWAGIYKGSKSKSYLSNYYDEIGKQPLAAVYVVDFFIVGGEPPPPPPGGEYPLRGSETYAGDDNPISVVQN